MTISTRMISTIVLSLFMSAARLSAEELTRYRGFDLGSDVFSVSAQAKVFASEAKVLHHRPAVIELLEWRPPYIVTGSTVVRDSVRQIAFAFYEHQLSKIVVDYERERTAGMTAGDMTDALVATYGLPIKPVAKKRAVDPSRFEEETGEVLAQWESTDSTVVLLRSTDPYGPAARFRLIMSSPRLEKLRRTAVAEAIRLDAREAPQREIARQKKEAEDSRASEEKARDTNKPAFRP
jgi:hypothetical protein